MYTAGAQCTANFVFRDAPGAGLRRVRRPLRGQGRGHRHRRLPHHLAARSARASGSPRAASLVDGGHHRRPRPARVQLVDHDAQARRRQQRVRRQRLRAGARRPGPTAQGQPEHPDLGRTRRPLDRRRRPGDAGVLLRPVEPAPDHAALAEDRRVAGGRRTAAGAGTSTPRRPASRATPAAGSSTRTGEPSAPCRRSRSLRSPGPTASATWPASCATRSATRASRGCGWSAGPSRSHRSSDPGAAVGVGSGGMGARRASTSAVVAVVGGVLLVTLLVAWAAAIGPGEVLRGDGPTPQRVAPTTEERHRERVARTHRRRDGRGGPDPGTSTCCSRWPWGSSCCCSGCSWSVSSRGRAWPGSRWANAAVVPGRHPSRRSTFDVLDSPEALTRELASGAAAQRDLLRSGTPRNAIVEVWNRFETLASNVGATRRPVGDVVGVHVAGARSGRRRLQRRLPAGGAVPRGRFSDHELAEEHRAAALAALEAIHAGLTATRPGAAR